LANPKTNAVRLLDKLGINYELRSYEVDESDLSAESVARKVGLPAEQVYKTLCCRGDRYGVCLALIAGDEALDLKALARTTGDRSLDLVALKDVQPLTGYIRGGVTALACKKPYPVWVDEAFPTHAVVSVSAGQRGLQILMAPADYVRITGAKLGKFARPKDPSEL
jgi:Cys-tRNA(Pro)/Cys-tRNA(Cys) deacylase